MISEDHAREASLTQDFEALSVSKRLVRSVSKKLKKKSRKDESDKEEDARGISMLCLGRGGGCKVGADTSEDGEDFGNRRSSSASEDGKGHHTLCGSEEISVDCFSNGVKDRFRRRNTRKYLELGESPESSRMHVFLPDDILELCLMRLPLTSLMSARLVCKKWRYLATTPRFMKMRQEGFHQHPWLFLFGAVKDEYCSGEIYAFDFSFDKWHRIDADILKGRFMFSVASICDEIFVVGGRSSLSNSGKLDRSLYKTHKEVFGFCPLTKSWRRVAPMKYARSAPILGICEADSDSLILQSQQSWQDKRFSRSRVGGVSDVYEDPHMLSSRRQCRNSFDENESMLFQQKKSSRCVKRKSAQLINGCKRFLLIAVGGLGPWDEDLDSGEIYDSATNKWTEICMLPQHFGIVCSGVICNGVFYIYSELDRLAGYDIERGFWVCIQTIPSPPRVQEYYPKFVSSNGRLFMLSVSWCEGDGQIGRRNKAIRKLWELDLMNLVWSEVSVHPDAPMDWNAAFVADRNLIFGVEMFKIFGQMLDFLTLCDVSDLGNDWRHISRSRVGQELDASSCVTKSIAVLHL